ncbi:uncharacterized protein LOC124195453 [Daphnia pulex]|uniref:uncharacterized protein LOC124195453 n=1 Tax=Daphnia pulex TaxID=6669 RepID=UPI001EDEBC44|nr:uncharacterized protein LOC124195453 [Daphnia pulex]XP_046445821.1 uncharacterized protein LOC124195453 [Daphnia pulex]
MEPVTSEEVTEVTINVDKEDTIISKPTGTRTYTGKITISVQKATQVKKEFASFRNDLLAQLVGEFIEACWGCCYGLLCLALPICMITIGSIFLQECPVEHYIPIYLIVAGVFSLISDYVRYALEGENGCCQCFLFCWFIAGCVWIYGVNGPSFSPEDKNYCNPLLYTFAYWIVTLPFLELVFLALLFVVYLCVQAVANFPV